MDSSPSLDQLFATAVALPAGSDLDAWVRDACGDDVELEVELRELLAMREPSDTFLQTPPAEFPELRDEYTAGQPLGHYRIEAEIGRGGMGVVYRGVDTELGRPVAIKTLPAALADDPRRLARLEQEARALAALNHPNVAAIHGVERYEGRRVLVLEYVEGETLAERLDRGPLPVDEALATAAQIAAGMEAAHDAGIVHRDLKPANVKITPNGQVKVLDFGLAKGAESSGSSLDPGASSSPDRAATELTIPGAIIGTAAYMSPEQARGRKTDRQTDVWAFGAILYECLTGVPLFRRETTADSITALLSAPVTLDELPPGTPVVVKDLLARCLQRDRDQRVRDMHDLRVVLEQDASTLAAPSGGSAELRRTRLVGGIASVLALIVVTTLITTWLPGRSSPTVAAPPATHLEVPVSIPHGLFGGFTTVIPVEPVALTIGGERFVSVDVSADGRTIAYVGSDPDDPRPFAETMVRIRSLDGEETRPVAGTERAARVSISPDGSRVALVGGRLGRPGLRCAAIEGGAVTTLLEPGGDLNIDPLSTPGWLSSAELLIVSTGPPALYRVPIDTAEPVLVATFERDDVAPLRWHAVRDPVLLPGGESVVVTHVQEMDGEAKSALVRVDLGSGAKTPILADAGQGRVTSSGHLVFVRGSTLCAAPFDVERLDVRGHATKLVDGLATGVFACSEQGTLVYARDPTDPRARRVMAIERGGRAQPLVPLTGPFRGGVRVSPDGRQLAVNFLAAPDRVEVRLLDLESATLRSIRNAGPHRTLDAGWTSDGRIFYHEERAFDEVGLAVAGPDLVATGEELFAPGRAPSWIREAELTPDGRNVVGVGPGGLSVFDVGGDRPPTEFPHYAFQPALSPDGRWLAHVEFINSGARIRLRAFEAETPEASTIVWTSPGLGVHPFWAVDGSELFYLDDETGALRGARFEAEPEPRVAPPELLRRSGQLRRFERRDPRMFSSRPVDVLPDGRFVYIGEPEPQVAAHLQVVMNWFTELRARVPAD